MRPALTGSLCGLRAALPAASGAAQCVAQPWVLALHAVAIRGLATAAAPKTAATTTPAPGSPSPKTAPTAPKERPAVVDKEALDPVVVPPKGPLGVAGAWRRTPGNRTVALMERSIHEQYRNLLKLVQHHMPPRPEAFHRILRNVASAKDLDVATKALHVCLDHKVPFSEHTASLWVSACLKAGNAAAAIEALKDAPRTRLFPNKTCSMSLVRHCAQHKDEKCLKDTAVLLSNAGLHSKLRFHEAATLVQAYAAVGDYDSALHMYSKLPSLPAGKAPSATRMTTSPYPTKGILGHALSGAKPPSEAQVAKINEVVLPVAASIEKLKPLAAEFKAKFAASAPPAPAATPAPEAKAT